MAAFGEENIAVPVITDPLLSLLRTKPTVEHVHGRDVNPPDTILLEKDVKAVIFDMPYIIRNLVLPVMSVT